MRGLVYRPIYVGGNPDDKYKSLANKMVKDLMRDGLKKDVFTDGSIIIIAKVIGNIKKVIFISLEKLLFLYTKAITFSNIATFGGWVGKLIETATLDFNDRVDPEQIGGFEIAPPVDGNTYLIPRKSPLALQPPYGEYVCEVKGRKLDIGEFRDFNYVGPSYNWRQLHRGIDRDFMYSTNDFDAPGSDAGAALHYRLWNDEDNLIVDAPALPASAPGFYWPYVGGDEDFSRIFSLVGNRTWLLEARVDMVQAWIWYLDPDGVWTNPQAFNGLAYGGSSLRMIGSLLSNNVTDEMLFSVSDLNALSGDPSDLEHLMDLTLAEKITFTPGTLMGYAERQESEKLRENRCWVVDAEQYGSVITNIGTTTIPDGIFLCHVDGTQLAYQAPDGQSIIDPKVDEFQPSLILFGVRDRVGGTNPKMLLLNVLTSELTEVSDIESNLVGDQFVR